MLCPLPSLSELQYLICKSLPHLISRRCTLQHERGFLDYSCAVQPALSDAACEHTGEALRTYPFG